MTIEDIYSQWLAARLATERCDVDQGAALVAQMDVLEATIASSTSNGLGDVCCKLQMALIGVGCMVPSALADLTPLAIAAE